MASALGTASLGLQQMMVGDDQVQAEAARGFSLGKGAHAGIDGDDQADALGMRRFQHARLQAVALAQAVRNVEAGNAAEHLDGCFEQDDGGGAVHIIIAVEQNRLARRRWPAPAARRPPSCPASGMDRESERFRD